MYQQRGTDVNTTVTSCGQDDSVSHTDRGSRQMLEELARREGTPIFIIDHEKIRENYREFKKFMPKIQVYFAVKANSNPEIVKTLLDIGRKFRCRVYARIHDRLRVHQGYARQRSGRTGSGTGSSTRTR